jgi:hypothetical protein
MEEDDTKALPCRNSDFGCSNDEIVTNAIQFPVVTEQKEDAKTELEAH